MESDETTFATFGLSGIPTEQKSIKLWESVKSIIKFVQSDDCEEADLLLLKLATNELLHQIQIKRMRKEIHLESPTIKRKDGQTSL